MASGFGTTYISSTRCSSGGAVVAATLSQAVNASARTVTVTLRVTAAYYRSVNRDWKPAAGEAIYGSDHTGNKVVGKIGGTTTTLKTGGKVGLQTVSNKTYRYNTKYSIPAEEVAVRSGYTADWSMSKTYSYNTNGDAITDNWYASMYLPGQGSTTSEIGGDTSTFTTDSIAPAATAPTGGTGSMNSRTWNTINTTASVTSWGNGYSGTPSLAQCICPSTATNSNWLSTARQVKWTNTTDKSVTGNITTGTSTAYDGGYPIKGCMPFKVAGYGQTNVGSTWTLLSTVYYTPPAPPTDITYTQTKRSTDIKVDITIKSSSSNNYSNTVETFYCYSTNGGSSYSNWISAGTGTPGTDKKASFTCFYGDSVYVKAKQTYQNLDSGFWEINFTADAAETPNNLTLSVGSSTWNSITMSGSCSYNKPDGINGRYICLGVNANGTSLAARTEIGYGNSASGSGTIDNSSTKKSGGVDLKGMLPVYPYIYANNTLKSAVLIKPVYYLPPAPGRIQYVEPPVGSTAYQVAYNGVAENNVSNYEASELRRTVRYKLAGDANWTVVVDNAIVGLTVATGFTINIPAQSSATVEAWMNYRGKNSDVSSVVITNSDDPVYIYGSVGGETKQIRHIYGPVNGETKKIRKIYASVNGVARKVFEDGS